MEEIKVVVYQEEAKIGFNYDEIKEQLQAQMEVYKSTEYTDDNIKNAKADRAALNKLSKELDDRRKAVKKEYNKPFDLFESKVKELIEIIKEPVNMIDSKVKDYEKREKQAKFEEIKAYWNEKVSLLDESIREIAWNKIYDDRWTLATATKKAYKDGIDNGLQQIVNDLESIESFHSEYEVQGIEAYKKNLQLSDAVTVMNQLQRQKEAILQKERERLEAEAKAKAEAAIKAEREKEKTFETPKLQEMTKEQVNSALESEIVDYVDKNVDNFGLKNESVTSSVQEEKKEYYTVRIPADENMLNQLVEYMKFAEIPYEVMK